MTDDNQSDDAPEGDARPAPRSVSAIFDDLHALCLSDGSLHQISAIIYRDHVLTIDMKKGRVKDAPARRWSTEKLNKQELMLLIGLAVQSTDGRTYMITQSPIDFAAHADRLLRELHDALLWDARPDVDPETGAPTSPPSLAHLAREAIYYGAESFYLHQFAKFAPPRYAADAAWLSVNAGGTMEDFVAIAQFIVARLLNAMTGVHMARKQGQEFAPHEYTDSLLIRKSELTEKFGDAAGVFIAKFSTPAMNANDGFRAPFDINAVAIAPLIDLGDFLYMPHQYRLLEAIYESPFYWMNADNAYRDKVAEHRGAFVEQTALRILRAVFGDENVYSNVKLRNGKMVVGEIDVLVIYGEYLLIGQAKSKRITAKAKAGDIDALNTDFYGAVQHPFEQAIDGAVQIRAGAVCTTPDGTVLTMPGMPRVFPTVFLSDAFPAVTFLSRALLKRPAGEAPVVWDLGILDCVARIFTASVDFLFYLKCRADAFDNVISDSEYNYVGYHLRNKLVLPEEADLLMIDRDYATLVDDFMVSADLGLDRPPPKGILQTHKIPFVSELLVELKSAPPLVAAVAMDLYDFSSAALESTSSMIKKARKEVKRGKALKAFSIPTAHGGFTYVVVNERSARMREAAHAIAAKRKYDSRSDRWYLMIDAIDTKNPIDALSPLLYPWQEDPGEAARSAQVASLFNSHQVAVRSGKRVTARDAND